MQKMIVQPTGQLNKKNLLAIERQQRILDMLRRDGRVHATDLSTEFAVSEDTIRRDLRSLDETGLLHRVHGGAVLHSPLEADYLVRQNEAVPKKTAIAQAAVRLVRDGQVIILDGGTTTLQVARQLPLTLRATVVTNSPAIVLALDQHPDVEILLVGGHIYKHSLVAVSIATVETLSTIHADLCFLGVCGLHPDVGITVVNAEEAYVKRAMIAGSEQVAAVATSDKLGTISPYIIGSIERLTHLVTEPGVPEEIYAQYRSHGVSIVHDRREALPA